MTSARRLTITVTLLLAVAVVLPQTAGAATLTIKNNCGYTVYPGIYPPVFNNGGWSQGAGATVSFAINSGFIGRVWGRTGCNGASPAQCTTGQCGGTGLQCAGTTGVPTTSLFEANINAAGTDWYDVSYVDAVDNPIGLSISNGACVSPSACSSSVISNCPSTLKSGSTCLSGCTKYGTDQYCCHGAFNTPATCIVANWGADAQAYVNNIHSFCPNEYSYAYDDPVGLHTCATGSNYTLTFCPSGGGGGGTTATPTPVPVTGAVSGVHTVGFQANANKRMDVNGASTANGTKVQVWDSNGTAAQNWNFSTAGVVPAGFYNIASLGAFCLDVNNAGTANGTTVQLWGCNGTGAQSWSLVNLNNGFYNFKTPGGKCLDVPNGNMTNGTQLQIWDCIGNTNQMIKIN